MTHREFIDYQNNVKLSRLTIAKNGMRRKDTTQKEYIEFYFNTIWVVY